MTALAANQAPSFPDECAAEVVPARGSLRVQAWIYTVVNPLVEWCQRDLRLLRSWNLSWSHVTGHAGSVRAARDQLGAAGRLNLDDLLRFSPELAPLLEAQEHTLFLAVEAARQTHLALIEHPQLRRAVLEVSRRGPLRDAPDDDAVADMVTTFINGGRDGEPWDELGPRLEQLPGLECYDVLKERLVAVADSTAALGEALIELRVRLCDTFDLPPGPIVVHTVVDRR